MQDAALASSGAQLPSDISPELTHGAEELHMLVLTLRDRITALESKVGGDLFDKAIALLRRHFGDTAV